MTFWRAWEPGMRVVVRYRNDEGSFSDAVGELVRVDDDGVEVATKRGPVSVSAAAIAIGKRVPPAVPPRR
ncbi:hypothetical protein [Pseudactinotalea terrae]|uniref:putative acetyltransferase n=1 Tax=Pseudactinotalea terrae TaxID=1743262 RepID=UPI0012E1D699|nr:hypothetical protein [Pseudactinotalea terrae]